MTAPVQRVRDLVICTTDPSEVSYEEFCAHPPVGSHAYLRLHGNSDAVSLGRGVVIDQISSEDAEAVMDACTPRGVRFSPVRQFGQRYSLIRDVDPAEHDEHPFAWDPDGVLADALAYSRLIRDNGYSSEYAARVADSEDGERMIVYTLGAEGKQAYRLRRGREWLDAEEANELAGFLAAFWPAEADLPGRVKRALWRVEYATWSRWADLVNSILVSGLESLLKTERHGATRQFKTRASALAAELGVEGFSADFCEQIYDLRSEWVHGAHVQLFPTGGVAEDAMRTSQSDDRTSVEQRMLDAVAAVQDLLRRALRRCVEDPEFRAVFADDDRIRERWPV